MLSTLLSVATIETLTFTTSTRTLLGYGLLATLIVAIVLSYQRWLLWYVLGGIAYWMAIEFIRIG